MEVDYTLKVLTYFFDFFTISLKKLVIEYY